MIKARQKWQRLWGVWEKNLRKLASITREERFLESKLISGNAPWEVCLIDNALEANHRRADNGGDWELWLGSLPQISLQHSQALFPSCSLWKSCPSQVLKPTHSLNHSCSRPCLNPQQSLYVLIRNAAKFSKQVESVRPLAFVFNTREVPGEGELQRFYACGLTWPIPLSGPGSQFSRSWTTCLIWTWSKVPSALVCYLWMSSASSPASPVRENKFSSVGQL